MGRAFVEILVAGIVWWIGAVVVFMMFDNNNHAQSPRERLRQRIIERRMQQKRQQSPQKEESLDGDKEYFLTHQGRKRRYVVHVPAGTEASKHLPVVLVFHGGMGRAEGIRKSSRMNDVADRHGFIAVYPDGSGLTKMLTYNAGTCCGYAVRENIDDVGFVRKVIDDLPQHHPIDTQRVYATGFSNGAMLVYRLGCELADKIVAIAPVSGDMGVDGPKPARPVPVIAFHGKLDPNSLYEGGKGKNQFQPTPHRSVAQSLAFWIKWNHCDPTPTETKGQDYIRDEYRPSSGQTGAPVVLYTLPEGGHTWPGGVDTTAHLNTGPLVKSVDASTIMWKFFEQFTLAGPVKETATGS